MVLKIVWWMKIDTIFYKAMISKLQNKNAFVEQPNTNYLLHCSVIALLDLCDGVRVANQLAQVP